MDERLGIAVCHREKLEGAFDLHENSTSEAAPQTNKRYGVARSRLAWHRLG